MCAKTTEVTNGVKRVQKIVRKISAETAYLHGCKDMKSLIFETR